MPRPGSCRPLVLLRSHQEVDMRIGKLVIREPLGQKPVPDLLYVLNGSRLQASRLQKVAEERLRRALLRRNAGDQNLAQRYAHPAVGVENDRIIIGYEPEHP